MTEAVELPARGHRVVGAQAASGGGRLSAPQRQGLLVVVNGRASGARSRLAAEVTARLTRQGFRVDAVVTYSEEELASVLTTAGDRRVVLVGGDGSLHAAANAPLQELPELALVPAGRANNIARARGIPTDSVGAVMVAAHAAARPMDVLRVETPERSLFALEGLSAGFQAEARARYRADNSSDLRQGVCALATAVRRYTPYRVEIRLDDRQIVSDGAAQLFLSNLPLFGFGFAVDPGADPADGRFEAILIQAGSRRALLAQLAAAYRGRHIGRPGVHRIAARHAELNVALPLVADSVPLGTTTASVRLERNRIRLAVPVRGRLT
jgi:diacylglycerol kinase (ATP)